MPKNIIICCDGTDNKLTINENTNVVHVYSCLKNDGSQVAYYNPGVGTITPPGIRNKIKRWLYKIRDLFSATSLDDNVKDAYIYLMNNYNDGDKIFLFGFSRGAYTVRMLSGILEMFGLLKKGNQNHFNLILQHYSRNDDKFHIGNSFKKRFCNPIDIHFMGIWDTVVSVGDPIKFYFSFPYSRSLKIVNIVRHAIAIDERRKHYRYSEVKEGHENLKEVFFAGVHSDIGGSYIEDGLSKITLEWMLGEASAAGLILDKEKVDKYLYGKNPNGKNNNYNPPDFKTQCHNSLKLLFIIADFLPRLRYRKNWFFNIWIDCALWPKRKINENAMIHDSVFKKMNYKENGHSYSPTNLKNDISKYTVVASLPIIY